MIDKIDNLSISLAPDFNSVENRADFVIHIIRASDAMMDSILGIPKTSQWVLLGICWIIILIGSYFKYIVYKYLYLKHKLKDFKPINILILINAIIDHLTVLSLALTYTLVIITETSLKDLTGPWFCYPVTIMYRFGIFYAFGGELGIAVYRTFLVRFDIQVKYIIGEEKLFYGILCSGLCMAALFTVLVSITDYENLFSQTCTIIQPDKRQVLQLLDNYEQGLGRPSIYRYWRDVRIIIGGFLALTTTTQIIIYFIFFRHIYKHDNTERLRRLLGTDAITLRNRVNATTFFGEFCSFIFNLTFVLFIHLAVWVGNNENGLVGIAVMVGGTTFSGQSVLKVFTSVPLRRTLFKAWR